MSTYIKEERALAVEPLEDITACELAVMMKKGFHPAFWMHDADKEAYTYIKSMIMNLPEKVLRHFVLTTHKVEYQKRFCSFDGEVSRELVKTERVSDLK